MRNEFPTLEELNAQLESEETLPTIDELNAQLEGEETLPTIDELNAQLETPKHDLGVWETLKTRKEAQFGKKMSNFDTVIAATPYARFIYEMEQNRNEVVEQRLYDKSVDNPIELRKLGSSIGLDEAEMDRLYDEADSGLRTIAGFRRAPDMEVLKEGFRKLVEPRITARVKARQEAQEKLNNAEELGFWGNAALGTVEMGGAALEWATPIGVAAETSAAIINRTAELGKDTYTLDENGKAVVAVDENGNEIRGDKSEWAAVKAISGGVADAVIWNTPVVGKMLKKSMGGFIKKIPGYKEFVQVAGKGAYRKIDKLYNALTKSESGRILLKTGGVLAKVEEKLHVGSLRSMMLKSRVSELVDDVVGLRRNEGETKDFAEWLRDFVSVDSNVDLLTGLIGVWAISAGGSFVKARGDIKKFRHGEGREEKVAEYIGKDAAKRLSNKDLDMLYRIVSSENLTAEKIEQFLDKVKADRAAAEKLIAKGKTLKEVSEAWARARELGADGESALNALKSSLEARRAINPEMEAKLDEKIAEYAEGQEVIAKYIKDDVIARLKDNRVFDDPEMLDEMVAMSARRFEPESIRLKIHDIRGTSMNEGQKISEIENLGVTDWQSAEQAGLTEKDRFGRYTGGAVRALNVIFHGTTKLQEGVKAGTVSGNLAENLLTAATCELGGRSAEERGELIDGILDRANGDEALANAMIRRLEADVDLNATVAEKLDRALTEAKAEVIKKRNPSASSDEVNGALVEPVEKPDGTITTTGEFVFGESGVNTERPMPSTPLEGVQEAPRLKGAELTFAPEGELKCQSFPEMRVKVSADGVELNNLSGVNIADPARSAEFAAVVAQVVNIAKRNGLQVIVKEEHKPLIQALTREIQSAGLAKTQAKLDTRSKLFSLLFKTTLGNGVTYDENSFVKALERSSNGKKYVNRLGDIYGFVDSDSVLHFNPAVMNFNTPIHEYGHLALDAVRKINPKLWEQGKKLIKDSDYYRSIVEASNDSKNIYSWAKGNDDAICDEALATMIGDRGEKLVLDRGVDSKLKAWLKEVWKAFKGAFGLADLTDEQVEKMTLEEFVDTINAELLSGREFGTKKKLPPSEKSVKRYDEAEGSGSNGLLRWRNDRGYLFAIPVDMERTQPGGKVVFATDDANITDWIQSALNGYDLRLSKSGKLYVKGRNGLPDELALIFGRFPTAGMNDGIMGEIASAVGNAALNEMSVDDLVNALKSDRANYDAWAKAKSEGKSLDEVRQEEHYADEAAREEAERKARWENSGMGILDYIRSRIEDGDPEFDLDWEIAREMANDRAESRFSIGGIFTGSAADYANRSRQGGVDDGPSLVKIGKSNGVAFGWGLYGSTAKSDAENFGDNIYEQTFFTNRPEGDESHLIDWEKPLTEENKNRILDGLVYEARRNDNVKNAVEITLAEEARDFGLDQDKDYVPESVEVLADDVLREAIERTIDVQTDKGRSVYTHLAALLTGKSIGEVNSFAGRLDAYRAASEFLRDECDIDGIKYPAESDGAKRGETHYVSFRDDNIRVDHKWTDGVARFSHGGVGPSKLGNGKQRYYEVPFAKAVDKIVKAKKPIGDEHVFVSKTPEVFSKIGFPRLPIMMTQKHVLSISSDEKTLKKLGYGKNVHAHGMKEILKQVPKALQRPLMVIASKSKPDVGVVAITRLVDKDGRSVIVPVAINGLSRIGAGAQIDAHIMTSAYGKDNAWSKLVVDAIEAEAQGKVGVFYIDNTRASMIQNQLARAYKNQKSGTSGLQLPQAGKPPFDWQDAIKFSGSLTTDFVHSITDPGSPVNTVGMVDQTASRQFKEWFGKSKVVDENGKPLVVYHGSNWDPMSEPNGSAVFRTGEGETGSGAHFGTRRAAEERGADRKNWHITPVYLNIKNPLRVQDTGYWTAGDIVAEVRKTENDFPWLETWDEIKAELKRRGYDGMVYKNVVEDEGSDSYIAFEPNQIKSATDNVGTFDSGNNDIRFHYVRGVDWSDITMDIFKFVPNGSITAMGETEQSAAGLAGAIEKRGALRPWTKADSPAANAKPIAFDAADMVMFWRAVSGSLRNPHVQKGERIKGRPDAIGLNIGGDRIEIVSKLFGVIDESDIKKLHEDCRAEGYFRNENTDWCAANDKGAIEDERLRSQAELDRRTRALYKTRVETGEGGEHYATQVLGHEIGHTLGLLPTGAKLGKVGDATRTLYEAFEAELKRQTNPLKLKRGEKALTYEIEHLIAWWHGTETMPEYYAKPKEKFAELFGIFLTQPESVQAQAPKAYDLCVKLIAGNEKLTKAYQTITSLKWDGKSNDAVMAEVRKTWDKEAQDQYRELEKLTKESMSLKRDKFFYSLDDRFGPMFAVAKRSLKKLKQDLKDAVRNRTMSKQEATDIIKAHEDEINALQTSLYNFQRHTGGSTRLMVSMFDDIAAQAEKDGVNWNDVRDYAHYMRVIEVGGRATAHAVDPARASAILDRMRQKLGDDKWLKIEKTWKAYRATYEKYVLDDPYVQELFDAETMKMLYNNKHYITMRHRMSLEEAKDWQERIEKSKKGEDNLWDPCIDIQRRLHKGLGGANGEGGGFVLYHLVGSFEATEDPLAATIRRAIEIKESAARNHLLKQMSDTLRSLGVKGVYDKVAESKETQVDRNVYGKFYYMDSGVKHELIVPKVIHNSMSRNADDIKWFNKAFRFWKNLVTSWSPRFVSRAYRMDISSMETNIKGMHKAPVDVISEALCFGRIGVPLYLVNDYVARFTRLSKTPFGKILWNENTANHYAYQAQQIVKIAYEGRYSERLGEARRLRDVGETSRAKEIEENVALAQEMMKLNIFQSNYNFNKQLAGFDGEEIMHQFGYRLNGKNDRKVADSLAKRLWSWSKSQARKGGRWWTRLGEEQEAVPKVIAMLYQMKKGITGEEAAATAIEYGGTPNLSRRGAHANFVEALTGAFWNVRKNASLRTIKAIKDHPTEWMVKNFAQTAMPTIVKYLMIGGVVEELIRNLFDDDEEKIKNNAVASMMYEHSRFIRESMKCVPGYMQRNYNVIPWAKYGNEVLSFRLKYSPEEFMIKRTIHGLFQAWGADPSDPSADWTDLTKELMGSVLPDVFGENPLLQMWRIVAGPFTGNNPFDNFRGRYIYDPTLFEARGDNKFAMAVEMFKQLHNNSPLNQLWRFSDGQDRNVDYSDMPKWLDAIVNGPVVSLIPGAFLSITSDESYIRALADIDNRQKANARIVAGNLLAACIENGRLGGFEEGLKDLPPHLKRVAIRYVLNGWRQFRMDPNAKKLRTMRRIKDPNLKRKARKWIEDAEKYGD